MNKIFLIVAAVICASVRNSYGVLLNGNQILPSSQITISSLTATGNGFKGNGSAITALTPGNISAGAIPSTVYVSSMQTGNYENIRVGTATISTKATALAATPTACSVGNYPLGVDAQGNAQNCTAGGVGNVATVGTPVVGTLAQWQTTTAISSFNVFGATNAWTAPQTFVGTVIFSSSVALSSTTVIPAGTTSSNIQPASVCFATVTLTLSGTSSVVVWGSGRYLVTNNDSNGVGVEILVDGKGGYLNTMFDPYTNLNSYIIPFAPYVVVNGLTAGTHSFCTLIDFYSTSNTATFYNSWTGSPSKFGAYVLH